MMFSIIIDYLNHYHHHLQPTGTAFDDSYGKIGEGSTHKTPKLK